MKILAASDLHSDKKAAEKLAKKAKKNKVDLVVLCGDILEMGSDGNGLIGPFKKEGIEVLMVHGNHDTPMDMDFLSEKYGKGVYNIHSYYKLFGDVAVLGAGGTSFGFIGSPDDDLFKSLKVNFKKSKGKKTVLLTHEPPLDTKLDNIGWTNAGSADIRKIIETYKPDLVVCGHIHETFGLTDYLGKTKIVNAGKSGVIIDI
ncbi:3',5'-cyclic adenosine monophosphate phosphodiesterase CpdA [Candidatus Tiddalikarchaeum anstoanum]|nr:3',5'-cyclic adenosine monophosphate phosphodiesterase CpdA [Candidatus Tiddalikarchaeum anstoanum]